jgi:hypothetical protein
MWSLGVEINLDKSVISNSFSPNSPNVLRGLI